MSFFADKYGRKKTLLSSLIIGSLSILGIGFSPNEHTLLTLMFFSGFGMGGYEAIIYAYVTEISGNRFRNFSTNILFITWGMA